MNKQKIKLYDGEKQVKKIAILALFRDDSDYLNFFIDIIGKIEELYDIEFSFYFCENDSIDDTREKLKNFSKGRNCKLLLLELSQIYKSDKLAVNFERVQTLAMLRNKLKETFSPFEVDWIINIDSGIYFKPEVLQDMFSYKPLENNVVMYCPFVFQIYTKSLIETKDEFRHIRDSLKNTDDSTNLIDLSHSFDTFPSIDKHGIMHYPFCSFKKCQLCLPVRSKFPYELIEENEEIAEVRSCFNGFAVIDAKYFNNPMVKWDSILLDIIKGKSLCEHVLFCDRLRTVSQKKIVILQNVKGVFRTN
jgi:hypothetical protein